MNAFQRVLLVLIVAFASSQTALAQGNLTPPGAPAPTMKSLSQIEPRIPISSPGATISAPGSYYLTTNTTTFGANGITISSGNVTLDLNGFTLGGGPYVNNGIYISGAFSNIVVRNGTIANWGSRGIDGYSGGASRNTVYENLNICSNASFGIITDADAVIRNCRVLGNGFGTSSDGISCAGGEISDCVTHGNSRYGITASHCTVRNCRSENNGYGLDISDGSVLGCFVANNLNYGIQLDTGYNMVRECHVVANALSGIYVSSSALPGGHIADCLVASNSYGININAPGYLISRNSLAQNTTGIIVQSTNCRVDENHIIVPAGNYGVQIPSNSYSNNVIVRNSVNGNAAQGYFSTGGSDFGPIGSANSATSPWANFTH